jgi:hypothetical protein
VYAFVNTVPAVITITGRLGVGRGYDRTAGCNLMTV